MANYYYEIADAVSDNYTGKYFAAIDQVNSVGGEGFTVPKHMMLVRNSQRIWKETDDGIFFVKHRSKIPEKLTADELVEFMWVKLSSKVIDG